MKNTKNKISEKIRNGLSFLSFIFDRVRISIGDSRCPLYEKCSQNDAENDCCVSFRGRFEIGGERTPCYFFNKQRIKEIKRMRGGILSKALGRITNFLVSISGERENED